MASSVLVAAMGTVGVALLLMAFVMNLLGRMSQDSRLYLISNIVGAGLSGFYAVLLEAFPLAVLEVVWALAAVYKLRRVIA